jgi:hypothetical protein
MTKQTRVQELEARVQVEGKDFDGKEAERLTRAALSPGEAAPANAARGNLRERLERIGYPRPGNEADATWHAVLDELERLREGGPASARVSLELERLSPTPRYDEAEELGALAPAEPKPERFDEALRAVINRYSRENGSNTPDHILADYLDDCLAAFDRASLAREKWYGRRDSPGGQR